MVTVTESASMQFELNRQHKEAVY